MATERADTAATPQAALDRPAAQSAGAVDATNEQVAPWTLAQGGTVDRHARALGRLATDGARRQLLRQLARAHGNRHAARVLARLQTAEGLAKIATKAKGGTGGAHWIGAHRLVWELIDAYCPEKGFALSGSSFDATQKGFRLDGTVIVIGDDVITRVAAGNADAVGKELATLLKPLPDPFGAIAAGAGIKSAPSHIALPLAADVGLQKAWEKSLPGKTSQEQGGILVTGTGSDYEFRAGKAGTSGTFPFNRQDVKKGETLVSVLHTHPYSAAEGGFTDVSFSGQDLALFATQKERMSIVRSGDFDFLAARSTEFDVRLAVTKDKNKLFNEIKKTWSDLYASGTGSLVDRARAATKATCLKYDLLYYEGRRGSLAQPRDMIEARSKKP